MKKSAFAAAVVAALVGCGEDSCPVEPADVIASDLPASCSVAPGVLVTVEIPICAQCNQTSAVCEPNLSEVGSGFIYLGTTAEACTSGSSCPIPSCGVGQADRVVLTCTFVAPPAAAYQVIVPDAGTDPITIPFFTTGTATTCSGA